MLRRLAARLRFASLTQALGFAQGFAYSPNVSGNFRPRIIGG